MPGENDASATRERTAQIVAAYLRHHNVSNDQLSTLIAEVHQALGKLGKVPEPEPERVPAVPVRRSVQKDAVICLDCGWKSQMLRRHLMTRHGLSPSQYRARWNLRPEYPLIAPGYSERRSALAKQLGLGRGGRAGRAATENTEQQAKSSRRQSRSGRQPGRRAKSA